MPSTEPNSDLSAATLDELSRIAACIGKRGFATAAIPPLKAAIHRAISTTAVDDHTTDLDLAYARLAVLDAMAGRRQDAEQHAFQAWNTSFALYDQYRPREVAYVAHKYAQRLVDRDLARIEAEAKESYARVTAGMSHDQKMIYDKEGGLPSHVERYDAANYHLETWWYNNANGIGYRRGYTFRNGLLESVYRP